MTTRKQQLLGDRIRLARLARGISQAALAKQLDVQQGLLWKWEKNRRNPRVPTLMRISEILDVSTDFLLRGITKNSGLPARFHQS